MKVERIVKSFFYAVLTFTILLFISSCQEVFTDDDIINNQKILVVQGEVTDNPGPYKITLRYASDFGSDKVFSCKRRYCVFN